MPQLKDTNRSDGHLVELFIADQLRQRGFVILEQNYTLGKLEVDLIALEGDTLCFIEVKARKHPFILSELEEVITPEKQEHMVVVSDAYCRFAKRVPYKSVRFDYVLVYLPDGITPKKVQYIRDAFTPTCI